MKTEYDEWIVYNKKNNVTNKNTIKEWDKINLKLFLFVIIKFVIFNNLTKLIIFYLKKYRN